MTEHRLSAVDRPRVLLAGAVLADGEALGSQTVSAAPAAEPARGLTVSRAAQLETYYDSVFRLFAAWGLYFIKSMT